MAMSGVDSPTSNVPSLGIKTVGMALKEEKALLQQANEARIVTSDVLDAFEVGKIRNSRSQEENCWKNTIFLMGMSLIRRSDRQFIATNQPELQEEYK